MQWVFVVRTARNSAVGIRDIEINSVPGRLHPFGGVTYRLQQNMPWTIYRHLHRELPTSFCTSVADAKNARGHQVTYSRRSNPSVAFRH
jgi:hypothetical protein